jgi:hypothetical protein
MAYGAEIPEAVIAAAAIEKPFQWQQQGISI